MAHTEGAPSYEFPLTITPGTNTDTTTGHDVMQATHTPDIPFHHEEDALPGIIIEVAYLQVQKDLRRLAYTYLVHSNAAVQVVFGFDLKGGPTRRTTFSVWRSKDEGDVLSMVTTDYDHEFRNTDGGPASHDLLCFRLQDFAMDDTAKEILGDDDAELSITMDRLCSFLSMAETKETDEKTGTLRMKKIRPGKRKLPLEVPPERPITAEDEEEWQHAEARATKRGNWGGEAYSRPRKLATELSRRKSGRLANTS